MKILVAAASKHGATSEIAVSIGETLLQRGFDVAVSPAEQVNGVNGYDAVVLGSAVYAGHWLKPALELVEAPAKPGVTFVYEMVSFRAVARTSQ